MAPREPTNQQISSRLSYSQSTPSFLQKFQNRMAGLPDEEEEDEYDNEYEPSDGSGRPPIPRRPAIPERPDDNPGSSDEDDRDEKPQVVVLREGKHLTEREAINVKRKERGLAALPEPDLPKDDHPPDEPVPEKPSKINSLSFSSSGKAKATSSKRKAIADTADDDDKTKKKKPKKNAKKLLSFDYDA